MKRLVFLVVVSIVLMQHLASTFDIPLDETSVGAGLAIAALVGAVSMGLDWFVGTIQRPFQKQVVVLPTSKTPWQVVSGTLGDLIKGIVVVLILIIILVYFLIPDIDIIATIEANIDEIAQGFGVTVE